MKESNPFWYPIQNALLWAKAKSVFGLVLIAAVFPVVECVFVNLWTSSPKETANPIFVVLAVIVGIHCVFVLMAILEEARSRSETVLPKAFQLQEDSDKLLRELKRREMTNKLVREAFDRLNVQTCQIELSPTSDAWCLGGFNNALWPILSPFTDNVDKALGVHGTRFSLEVYFTQGTVPIHGCRNDCHRNLSQLAFFSSTHIGNCVAVSMPTKCSPAQIGFDTGRAFEQHIDQNRQLFYEGERPSDAVYFRRYATCPINENCGEAAEGVLVLTSMQDEPFADDVLETLAFLATIIASYLSAYRRCYYVHNARNSRSMPAIGGPSPVAPKQAK